MNASHILKSQPLPQPKIVLPTDALGEPQGPKKRLAAITTAYYKYSHADDIITKFIEGYGMVGGVHQPHCEVVSLHVEQFVDSDIGHGMAVKYNIPLFDSPAEALALGGKELAVDGVILVGEHGEFPINEKGQKEYPRRRLFEEIVKIFRASGRSAPVFNDKHLAYAWDDATWMYQQAKQLGFPLMAGSSVPVAWRLPPLAFKDGIELDDALSVYYAPGHIEDGVDYASYHTLETLQAFVEHRQGGETGVRTVQLLEGDAAWQAADDGLWSPQLLAAALKTVPSASNTASDAATLQSEDPNPVVILVEYSDGFRAGAYLTRRFFEDEFCFAAKVKDVEQPVATLCYMIKPQRDHFSFLCNHIEVMFRTGKPSLPVERTYLVGGILAAAADSRFEGQSRIETPHLASLGYTPSVERAF
ncbi:MAG: hypothetical protein CMJ64_23245 [Planctomycetaceae bacterium]|nr:hypothetical protein [Planctomycetaceae bacterium]